MILKGQTSVKKLPCSIHPASGYHPLCLRSSEKRKELAQIVQGFGRNIHNALPCSVQECIEPYRQFGRKSR
jgi:hypothetical protein